jgi:hypothetical protein
VLAGEPPDAVHEALRLRLDRFAGQVAAHVVAQGARAGVSPDRLFCQAFARDHGHVAPQCPTERRKRRGLLLLDDPHDLVDGLLLDVIGGLSGEQFVEHDPEGIHVRADVDVIRIAPELLRAHVLKRADELADARLDGRQGHVRVGCPSHTEVDHFRLARGVHQDVAGLEISVDHPLLVTMSHGIADASEEVEPSSGRQCQLVGVFREGPCIRDVLHHEVRHRSTAQSVHAHGVDVGDARVLETAQDLRLVLEPPEQRRQGKAGTHHLHGHRATGLFLLPFVHAAHASLGDQPHDRHATDVASQEWVAFRIRRCHSNDVRQARERGV